jgi:hypothetical protein
MSSQGLLAVVYHADSCRWHAVATILVPFRGSRGETARPLRDLLADPADPCRRHAMITIEILAGDSRKPTVCHLRGLLVHPVDSSR